jgi:Iron-containing redox enzyme
MASTASVQTPTHLQVASIREHIDRAVDDLLASLPDPAQLTADQRRGIIARYSGVLEGNFIYWMTGAYLSVGSDEARSKILDNLQEEVRDSHPNMLRKFAIAAHAAPTESDASVVYPELTNVRLFVGRLSPVPVVLTMAFFEGFIQRFMTFLAELAQRQGSVELEYTDVHGVCDITHTQELFHSLAAEIALSPIEPGTDLFEGVDLLRALIQTIVRGGPDPTLN